MSATGLPRSFAGWARLHAVEAAWIGLACANYGLGLASQSWETLPFRIGWVVLTVAYGLVFLREDRMMMAIFAVAGATAGVMVLDAMHVIRLWNTPVDIPPIMAVMCLVMVWHAHRRNEEMRAVAEVAEERRSLLQHQERFVSDASHELRTPLTIARGHLELLRAGTGGGQDLDVALEEMTRLDGIIGRLLLLAAAAQPNFVRPARVEVEPLLDDVFVRWVDIARRTWRLGPVPKGRIEIDSDRIRTALDALLENAVKYTDERDAIELRGRLGEDGVLILEVADEGHGIPAEALERIFDRFGRADPARGRSPGGVGLGLAIVDAIAKSHNGRCTVRSSSRGTVFALELPGFIPDGRAAAPTAELPSPAAPVPSAS